MRIAIDNTQMKSNAKFERQTFGVADMSIIINLLTKLYSNPMRTLTQEYISNARDANREAKATRPIEITAPSRFNPLMSIRDFGLGLSPDRINSVFLLYGASTKRNTNNQVGGFGIGAKSAWSYTDSFNIITYIDGTKRTYIAHKSSGNGNLDLISEEPTKEPNGTEIQIAIKASDVSSFRDAIIRTTYFWHSKEKPIYKGLDNSELPNKDLKGFNINSNFTIYDNIPSNVHDSYSNMLLVVDGIPYEINDNFKTKEGSYLNSVIKSKIKKPVAIHVNNGVANIAPNREEIVFDDHNNELLNKIVATSLKDCEKYIESELSKHTDIKNAIKSFVAVKNTFSMVGKYKGFTIDRGMLTLENVNFNGTKQVKNKLGQLVSKPDGLFYRTDLKRSTNLDDTIAKKLCYEINTDCLDNLYWLDVDLNHAKINYALNKVYQITGKHVFLLNKERGEHDKLKVALDAKPISSIDISDYQVNRTYKAAQAKLDFTAHYFSGGTMNATQKTVDGIKELVTYATFDSQWYTERHKYSDLFSFMYHTLKIKFFFVAKSSEKHLKSNSFIVGIDEFLTNYMPDESLIKSHIASQLYGKNDRLDRLKDFTKVKSEIADKRLKAVLDLADLADKASSLPNEIIPKIETNKLYKELKDIIKDPAKYKKQLINEFPLLEVILDPYNVRQSQNFKDALANYLNNK